MLRILLSACCTLVVLCSLAQTVIISKDPDEKREHVPEYGMNRKHYSHSFFGIQFMVGPPEHPGAEIVYGRSRTLEYGYRYKRRLSNTFSFGSEVTARRQAYHIQQSAKKAVPDTIMRDREKIVLLDAGIGVYKRINYGSRGDYIGRFVDVGAYGGWLLHARHVYFFEENKLRYRVRINGVKYPASLNYGLSARLGFNNFVIKGTYSLSDRFRESADLPELPRYTVGLEIGLHPF